MGSKDSTPSNDTETEILGDGHLGNDIVLGIFDDKDGNVDTGDEPRVLQSVSCDHLRVLFHHTYLLRRTTIFVHHTGVLVEAHD